MEREMNSDEQRADRWRRLELRSELDRLNEARCGDERRRSIVEELTRLMLRDTYYAP